MFSEFEVWCDTDSDAVVDPGELRSVDELGLSAFDLVGFETGETPENKENYIYATSKVLVEDGTIIRTADLFISYSDKEQTFESNEVSTAALMAAEATPAIVAYDQFLPHIP